MKKETKIEKLQAKFIKEIIQLNECKNLKEANAACRIDPKKMREVLKKHDQETFIKINSWIDEDIAFSQFNENDLKELSFDRYNKSDKFKKFLELMAKGMRRTTDLEKEIPCTRRFVIHYRNCLKRAIIERRRRTENVSSKVSEGEN